MGYYDKLHKHEVIHKSFREHLIPLKEWYKQVNDLECNGHMDELYNITDMINKPLYTVPYPYKTSIWYDMINIKAKQLKQPISTITSEDFTETEFDCWERMFSQRVDPFVKYAIHDNLVSQIDSNSDYGVIIQTTTGAFWPFD